MVFVYLIFFQELIAAKKQFEIIVTEHKNVVFPLAYLGTGKVFYKQNRCDNRFTLNVFLSRERNIL